jgi:hypothetical protein
MKRPQPDVGDTLKASFISDIRTINMIKRYWGTTTVNGIEVLKHRQYYFPHSSRSPDFEKLFKFLGAYEDVTASDPKGVDSAWMYFNRNNNVDLSSDSTEFVASNLNQLWWDDADGVRPAGLTLTTNIVIEAKKTSISDKSIRPSELLDPSSPKPQLMLDVAANYEALWNTCLISQQGVGVINKGSITDPVTAITTQDEDDLSPNDPWLEVISRYALRDNNIPCTIKDVSIGIGTEGPRLYNTYVVTLEIPYNTFSEGELFVSDISADLDASYTSKLRTRLSYPNGYWTKKAIKSMDSSDLADPTVVTRPYRLWEDEAVGLAVYDPLWLNYGGVWYLRADALSNPRAIGLTHKQLGTYVLQLIDSGYKKKEAPWWKKLLAIIVFVIAVKIGMSKYGLELSAAIATAGVVLNLATVVLSVAGLDEWALAFASVNKAIEPLVQLASIVNMAESLGELANKLDEAGSISAFIGGETSSFVDEIVKGAKDVIAGNITTDASAAFMSKAVSLLTASTKLKIATLNARNKDLKAEYDKLIEDGSREHDILRGFAKLYAKPATADWSMYASLYDLPYERGGGNLAMGNIQKTTKQAIRKSDYNEPMFENTLIM